MKEVQISTTFRQRMRDFESGIGLSRKKVSEATEKLLRCNQWHRVYHVESQADFSFVDMSPNDYVMKFSGGNSN